LTVGIQPDVELPEFDIELVETTLVEGKLRIPDTQLKLVGYVCEVVRREGNHVLTADPYATGFFVAIPCESPELNKMEMYYFVTAKHVASDLKDRDICFSANKKGGGITYDIPRIAPVWYLHPTDSNADVAVIQVALSPTLLDTSLVSIDSFALPQRLNELNVGIGNDVYSIGLFSPFPGNDKNIPIVRFGNVSMMPAETIQTDLGHTEMYLVEARSIGGMSGSPVFVRPTLSMQIARRNGPSVTGFLPGTGETLLGMAQGHWDIREEDINKASFTQDRKRGVNYGIALVVPAFKIYETIYQPGLVAMRKQLETDTLRQQRSVPGSDSSKDDRERPFTQEDFETALRKASRKIEGKRSQ
jgi:trypsin-like peptidase